MKIEDIIRIGNVDSVNPSNGTVRVRFPDRDNKVSKELKVIYHKTHKDKYYFMPEINEIVLCVYLPNAQEEGFVLGAFYNQEDTVPVSDSNKKAWYFSDGGIIEYDKSSGNMLINVINKLEIKSPNVEITSDNITLNASSISLNGNTEIAENLNVSGSVKAKELDASGGVKKGGVSYNHP